MKKFSDFRLLVGVEFVVFALASSAHAGTLLRGHEHFKAALAEGVIAAVLAGSLTACLLRPAIARGIAIVAQSFALLGTIVGAILAMVGIGPRTPADFVVHLLMLAMLTCGLLMAISANRDALEA